MKLEHELRKLEIEYQKLLRKNGEEDPDVLKFHERLGKLWRQFAYYQKHPDEIPKQRPRSRSKSRPRRCNKSNKSGGRPGHSNGRRAGRRPVHYAGRGYSGSESGRSKVE